MPVTCTCPCLVGTKYDHGQKIAIATMGVLLVAGAVGLTVATMGAATPVAIAAGVGVGALSGMGVTALVQTGISTAMGQKIDYLQFAKQMAIGGTIGSALGAGAAGLGAAGVATTTFQVVVTPAQGKAGFGLAKQKWTGKEEVTGVAFQEMMENDLTAELAANQQDTSTVSQGTIQSLDDSK